MILHDLLHPEADLGSRSRTIRVPEAIDAGDLIVVGGVWQAQTAFWCEWGIIHTVKPDTTIRYEKSKRDRLTGKTDVRVGITTGHVVACNVGGGGRENYTVHGDAVNLAARLEALNKDLGTRILVSHSIVSRAGAEGLKPVGTVQVRGQTEQSQVYTLSDSPVEQPAP